MRKNCSEAKKPGFPIKACGLDRRDLMPAKAFAHDVQSARQRGVTKRAVRLAREGGPDGGNERFLWIGQLYLRLGERRRESCDGITGAMHGWRLPCLGDRS